MKIAMMSAWNTDSGVSIHAELLGREWIRMGHQLKIFTFFKSDFHGTTILKEDEDYVVRCFTTSSHSHPYLDPRPILSTDYEVFVVQDLGMLPMDELAKIFHHIRKRANTITIIHDSKPNSNSSFYQFDWDRIVCFDKRYEEFLRIYHPEDRIQIIPFPCHPIKKGNHEEARRKLGLPLEKKIVLMFGQRIKEHLHLIPAIRDVSSKLSLLLLIVSQKDIEDLEGINGLDIEIRRQCPSIESLYDYLHASDVLILQRASCDGVVVSSSAFQCLGSGCPILANESPFFETLKDVVVTYSDIMEFKESLLDILNKGIRYHTSQKALEEFIKRNSSEVIAKRYIELFQTLKEEQREKEFDQVSRIMRLMGSISPDNKMEKISIPSINELEERRLRPQ